ncbi:hypothetical protein C3941_10630 [Kaistia algarum]|uniref:glycosyl transferase family 90 n=1 Tax=Kaistia algarum TaxID=2083279 RepID=UPI000CE7B810|nr:glycosyl transferase family 90 [Kaistia algarum]MCX5514803.1 glycosyl transferase family 90 [Kaistia algarum]PPE79567.1 hypothetical protein C3941_10630 [Kaistia algarum]
MLTTEKILFGSVPKRLKEEAMLRRLGTALPTMTPSPPTLAFEHGGERSRHRHQVAFGREGNRLSIILDRERLAGDWELYRMTWRRLPTLIRLLSRASRELAPISANISDGGGNQPEELAFCSDEPQAFLVPDPAFMTTHLYEPFRELGDSQPDRWHARRDTLLWRGAIAGEGLTVTQAMEVDDPALKQRVRLCLALRGLPDVDVKLLSTHRDKAEHQATAALGAHGILGGSIAPSRWIDVKFALDIDGPTNSWANFYTRLLLGCCVLKVSSQSGFRQWYYDDLVEWTHYVPVAADLSDLIEKVEWCREHDLACRDIANAGQEFALRRTAESETVATVQRINERFGAR